MGCSRRERRALEAVRSMRRGSNTAPLYAASASEIADTDATPPAVPFDSQSHGERTPSTAAVEARREPPAVEGSVCVGRRTAGARRLASPCQPSSEAVRTRAEVHDASRTGSSPMTHGAAFAWSRAAPFELQRDTHPCEGTDNEGRLERTPVMCGRRSSHEARAARGNRGRSSRVSRCSRRRVGRRPQPALIRIYLPARVALSRGYRS